MIHDITTNENHMTHFHWQWPWQTPPLCCNWTLDVIMDIGGNELVETLFNFGVHQYDTRIPWNWSRLWTWEQQIQIAIDIRRRDKRFCGWIKCNSTPQWKWLMHPLNPSLFVHKRCGDKNEFDLSSSDQLCHPIILHLHRRPIDQFVYSTWFWMNAKLCINRINLRIRKINISLGKCNIAIFHSCPFQTISSLPAYQEIDFRDAEMVSLPLMSIKQFTVR